MTTVAFLGTGTMGAPMARNLLRNDFTVRAWNRTLSRAEEIDGASVVTTPAAAVAGAEVIVTMLSDGPTVAAVMADAEPGVEDGQVWVQMSTVGIDSTAELASFARSHRLSYVDAPVLGTRVPAEQGTLTVVAAAPQEAREALQPLFDAVGSRTLWLDGDPATAPATRLKLVANTWVLSVVTGTAEALGLAKGLNVDPQRFFDVIAGGTLDLPYLHMKGEAMLADEYTPNFSASNAAKDAYLILDAAAANGVRMDATKAAAARLSRAIELGRGDDDFAVSYVAGFE